jgi:putative component of membrane protein insertase Oxa1/YidC/SpoIIIJ protein YidD
VRRFALFVLLGLSGLCAFPDETWEPSDVHLIGSRPPSVLVADLSQDIALSLIQMYQEKISLTSISRCPFSVSCSNFASRAISRKGLTLGLVMFIDRYYYRENATAFGNYDLVRADDGILKIDDSEYLD